MAGRGMVLRRAAALSSAKLAGTPVDATHAARRRSAIPSLRAATGFAAIVVLSVAYLDHVFRLRTGIWLRAGLGGWIDPYLINAILEQWRYSVRHLANPIFPPIFFPEPGTLGYSHQEEERNPAYELFLGGNGE